VTYTKKHKLMYHIRTSR